MRKATGGGSLVRARSAAKLLFALASALGASGPIRAEAEIFTVNVTDDQDDGVCDAAHRSLREAITAANAASGADSIHFGSKGRPRMQLPCGWWPPPRRAAVRRWVVPSRVTSSPAASRHGGMGDEANRGLPASARPASGDGSAGAPTWVLEGEYWTIGFAGRIVRVRDAKGFHYLSELLSRPGERVGAGEILAAGGGPGGRLSEGGPDEERARLSVTKRIRAALERIRESHPALGEHLAACVRTGRLCAYSPDPRSGLRWIVSSDVEGRD